MKINNKISLVILTSVIIFMLAVSACSQQAATTGPISSNKTISAMTSISLDKVELNYFYQKDVCPCLTLANQLVNDTVSNDYQAQLNNGTLTFKTFDSDDPANAGVIAQFEAPKFAFFITTVRGTLRTTKNVGGLWVYISQTSAQQDKFVALLKKEVDKALAGN
jgi:hypothetical protein